MDDSKRIKELQARIRELEEEIKLKDKKIEILTKTTDELPVSKTLSENECEVITIIDDSNQLKIKDGEMWL